MKTILLVEDNDDFRDLVGLVLRDDGYQVCEAENGEQALAQLKKMLAPPSLMLLDLMMPVMGGRELLEILSHCERFATLPVVVLSAGGEASQVPDATKFIRKPADLGQLRHTVRAICGGP